VRFGLAGETLHARLGLLRSRGGRRSSASFSNGAGPPRADLLQYLNRPHACAGSPASGRAAGGATTPRPAGVAPPTGLSPAPRARFGPVGDRSEVAGGRLASLKFSAFEGGNEVADAHRSMAFAGLSRFCNRGRPAPARRRGSVRRRARLRRVVACKVRPETVKVLR
jgi:hypothetical protein